MYSANYLFSTGSIRWAVDPLEANWRVHSVQQMDLKHDLRDLAFGLPIHDHKDHLDLDLIKAHKGFPIRRVIPEFIARKVQRDTKLMHEKIVVPQPLQPIHLHGVTILPFEGQHVVTHADAGNTGVPEMGYLVEFSGKHLLFLADTRIYDKKLFPQFGKVDLLFAHLWPVAVKRLKKMLKGYLLFMTSAPVSVLNGCSSPISKSLVEMPMISWMQVMRAGCRRSSPKNCLPSRALPSLQETGYCCKVFYWVLFSARD